MGPSVILSPATKDHAMPFPRPAPGTGKWWVIGILGCAAGTAAAIWLGLAMSLDRVTGTNTGHRVVDDRSDEVDVAVHPPAGQAVTCLVQALDQGYATVGSVEVAIPESPEGSVHRQVTVRTTTRAVTGVVKSCSAG